MSEPCLTCNEEYEAMVAAQAKRKTEVRAYHDGLASGAQTALETLSPSEEELFDTSFVDPSPVVEEEPVEVETLPDEPQEVETFEPEAEAEAEETESEVEQPSKSASRGAWAEYALSLGATAESLEGKNRDALAKEYGT